MAGARSTFAPQKSIIQTMGLRVVKSIMSPSNLKSQTNAAEIFPTDFLTPQNKELEAAAMAELLIGNTNKKQKWFFCKKSDFRYLDKFFLFKKNT